MANETKTCPGCGEPVEPGWKICPVCERPLGDLVCPQCGKRVKEHWKRCPDCEALLLCRSCGARIPPGHRVCPGCEAALNDRSQPTSDVLKEPVTGMELVYVPAGVFMMGDTFGDGVENELPVHQVELDAFYIGRYPVTQEQWKRIMEVNPSKYKGENLPVEQVSWVDVGRFIQRLEQGGRSDYHFSLPTEAEWEYAARSGGREERYPGGEDVDAVAWYQDNSDGMTQPVGKKAPNGLGLYDMSGNVWEWCLDTFRADAYRRHGLKNPLIQENSPERVIRGGGWNVDAWSVRCARRFSLRSDFFGPGLGFRLIMRLRSSSL